MLNLTRQTVKLPTCGEQEELVVVFDHTEARGTLILRECAFGLELLIPSISPFPVAVLDFWHTSEAGQIDRDPADPAPALQIIVHSPAQTEDPVGRVRFFPRRTLVDFERGVERLEAQRAGYVDLFYAYPLGDYPPVEQIVNHNGVQVFRTLTDAGEPSPTWFTTDPDDAGPAARGYQFGLNDLITALRALDRRPGTLEAALGDPERLRQLFCAAIECNLLTADGLADWQSWPWCRSCRETLPPTEHTHVCAKCGATLCNACASHSPYCPGC